MNNGSPSIQSVGILDSIQDILNVARMPSQAPALCDSELSLNLDVNSGGYLAGKANGIISDLTVDIFAATVQLYLDPEKNQRLNWLSINVSDPVNVGVNIQVTNVVTGVSSYIQSFPAPITGNFVNFFEKIVFGIDLRLRLHFPGTGAGDTANIEGGYLESNPYCQLPI